MRFRIDRANLQGLANQRDAAVEISPLLRDDAEEMQRFSMFRLRCQNTFIARFGLLEAALLVIGDGGGEHLIDGLTGRRRFPAPAAATPGSPLFAIHRIRFMNVRLDP